MVSRTSRFNEFLARQAEARRRFIAANRLRPRKLRRPNSRPRVVYLPQNQPRSVHQEIDDAARIVP